MHSFTQADVDRLEAEIKALLPEAETDRWCDYGYTLWVKLGDKVTCACCPERRADNLLVQERRWLAADEVKRLLTDG